MIMIVEDEEYVRDFLSLLLRERYDVIDAANGVEAINKLNVSSAIDLILLDLHMPGINGMDLLRALRKEVEREIPVIIVTAYSSKEIRDEALELGARDFISKPFSIEILEKAIQKVLAPK
jgi:CheY-like chemotaxis protein